MICGGHSGSETFPGSEKKKRLQFLEFYNAIIQLVVSCELFLLVVIMEGNAIKRYVLAVMLLCLAADVYVRSGHYLVRASLVSFTPW